MTQRFSDLCDSLILNAPLNKEQQLKPKAQKPSVQPQPPLPPTPPQRRQSQPVGAFHLDSLFIGRGVPGFGSPERTGINTCLTSGSRQGWSVTGIKGCNETPFRGQKSSPHGVTDFSPSSRNGSAKLVSQGNLHNRIQRQRSLNTSNDDAVKRSRPHQNSYYQLSQDLHDKQVEMLERKYGGSIRSRRAARTIQRAFRQYCLNKNFQKLRHSYGERRLSKRFSELGRSNTVWSDWLPPDLTEVSDDNGNIRGVTANEEEDAFGRNIRNMVAEFERINRSSDRSPGQQVNNGGGEKPRVSTVGQAYLHRGEKKHSIQPGVNPRQETEKHLRHLGHNSFSSPEFDLDCLYNRGGKSKSSSIGIHGSNASGGSVRHVRRADSMREQQEMSSSGEGGDFVRSQAAESTTVDHSSLDLDALLGSKETDILTDSFQDMTVSSSRPVQSTRHSASSQANNTADYAPDMISMSSSPGGSYDTFRVISVDPSDYMSDGGDSSEVKDATAFPDEHGQTYPKEEAAATQTKYYATSSPYRHSDRDFGSPGKQRNVAVVAPTRGVSSDASPVWRRKGDARLADQQVSTGDRKAEVKRMSNISETSEADSTSDGATSGSQSSENVAIENSNTGSDNALSYQRKLRMSITHESQTLPRTNDKVRKRLYRIGLNLFNKKPERGLDFLLDKLFLEGSPKSVARFFITRKGLSKQMIGEFLGNLQNPFSQKVLQCFCEEIDLSGLQVDMALRKFQCHFRMPGEAQKIERLMEAFADRYCECNPDLVKNFKNPDTVFLLAFAIIMLNTDLHNHCVKVERKMKLEEFIKNMRGIDDGEDIDSELLTGIYDRVKSQEFKAGVDQVTQVMKVEQTIIGKKPSLSLPHRRLVCYCRLYEVHDPNKKEKIGLHQREVFLFNDLLLVTKIFSKKKAGITYSFRSSLSLCGMQVYLFETSHYQYGIQLTNNIDGKPLITFNARNDHDRQKFVEDLKESILETNGMEQIRIEEEMARHRSAHTTIEKRYACDDSRVLAYDLAKASENPHNRLSAPECNLKKVSYSNSLTDLNSDPVMKRGSSGASLDSGMASGSVGSACSDIQQSSMFSQSPTTLSQAHGTPPLGQASGKRHPPSKAPVILKPGVPDGTEV